jgi:hypothetical protein
VEFLARGVRLAHRNRFSALFVSLIAFILVTPGAELVEEGRAAGGPPLLETIAFMAVLTVAAGSVQRGLLGKLLVLGLGLPAAVLGRVTGPFVSDAWEVAGYLANVAFLGYVIAALLGFIFRGRRVTRETLAAAMCVYLLLGAMWALAYSTCAALEPSPFAISGQAEPAPTMRIARSGSVTVLYFSYTTLTTVGYGDIVPTSAFTRMLANVEALAGQLYLTVLVARLVSLHIAHAQADDPTRDGPGQ